MGDVPLSASQSNQGRRYQTLDGLRGVAAIAVVLHHGGTWFSMTPHLAASAVDLFFVLSGFVLAAAYGEKLEQGFTPGKFMVMRFVRLYPLYLAGLLVAIFALALSLFTNAGLTDFHAAFWKAVPFAALMLPSPGFGVMGNAFPLNPPAWSLFFELLINLLFCATYRYWTVRNILVVAGACALAILADPPVLNGGWSHANFADGVLRVGCFFPLGVLLFKLEPRLPRPAWLRAWHCLALFSLLVWLDPGPLTAPLLIVGYPLLVAAAAGVEPPPNWAGLYARLGQLSYPIYAVHFPVLSLIAAAQKSLGLGSGGVAMGLTLLFGLMLMSALLDRLYDRPVRRFLSRRV